MNEKAKEELKTYILDREKKGKVVVRTYEGLKECRMDNLLEQPIEGVLYDLNRNKEVILTQLDDLKWVNDYAATLVIEKLMKDNLDLKKKLKEYKGALERERLLGKSKIGKGV